MNTERMNTFLYTISEQNQHMKASQKKEYVKLYGLSGEIFEETLMPFIPKIMGYLQKKIKVRVCFGQVWMFRMINICMRCVLSLWGV